MSWLIDTQAQGKTMHHTDGTKGVVLNVQGAYATLRWEDGIISTEHEDFLIYPED